MTVSPSVLCADIMEKKLKHRPPNSDTSLIMNNWISPISDLKQRPNGDISCTQVFLNGVPQADNASEIKNIQRTNYNHTCTHPCRKASLADKVTGMRR